MSRKMTAVAAVALVTLAGCLDDGEFGGTGGWGGSSAAGERLAHQVCTEAVRDKGLRVVDIHKTNSVDHPFPRARPFKKGNNVSTARKLGPLACAITFAVPALAQDGTPVDPSDIDAVTRMSNAVADAVVENVQSFEIWDDGDTPRLLLVARQKGLSMNCEGFEVVKSGSARRWPLFSATFTLWPRTLVRTARRSISRCRPTRWPWGERWRSRPMTAAPVARRARNFAPNWRRIQRVVSRYSSRRTDPFPRWRGGPASLGPAAPSGQW